MSDTVYIGITIGPIADVLEEAATPASLWFGSYLFADLSGRLCEKLQKNAGQKLGESVCLITPHYPANLPAGGKKDSPDPTPAPADGCEKDTAADSEISGVGDYPDRIIFSVKGFQEENRENLDLLVREVKRETVKYVPDHMIKNRNRKKAEDFLQDYLQISYAVLSEEEMGKKNANDVLSPYLNSLELMRCFPADQSDNIIRQMMRGRQNGQNYLIKDSPLYKSIEKKKNQLKSEKNPKNIREIEDIASCGEKADPELKKSLYFAVVNSDGDNMGAFLRQLNDDAFTEYDDTCLRYRNAASERIGSFGGMTVFAGGDDLLFLAPVENEKGETIFDLCHEIKEIFRTEMTNFDQTIPETTASGEDRAEIPTVSFGISVQHIKFPLYEALKSAENLLAEAKKTEGKEKKEKNKTAVELKKHSGKCIGFILSNEKTEYELLSSLFYREEKENGEKEKTEEKKEDGKEKGSEVVHSVIYTLEKFSALIAELNRRAEEEEIEKERYLSAWMNLFDSVDQQSSAGYLKRIGEVYYDHFIREACRIRLTESAQREIRENAERSGSKEREESLQTLLYLLRFVKFFREKAGEKD